MKRFSTVVYRYISRQNATHLDFENSFSHASIFQLIQEPKALNQVHANIITYGLSHNIFLSNRLMNSYASFGLIAETQKIFSRTETKNLVSWTILVSAFTKNDKFFEAVDVFRDMTMIHGLVPNPVTITSILPAFGHLGLKLIGKSVHCFWVRQCFQQNVFVETALVDMYAKLGCLISARKVFDNMFLRNVVSWNVMISGYSDTGYGEEALKICNLMRKEGFFMDCFTIMSIISASSRIEHVHVGAAIHALTIREGLGYDEFIQTALMDMYLSRECVDDAYRVFIEMPVKDVVAWTSMLTGFSCSSKYKDKAIRLLNEMRRLGFALDSVALMGVLSNCSFSGSLQQGKQIHTLVVKTGFEGHVFVGSSLIKMYANCGNLESSRNFFIRMHERDVACWNAMIAAYGSNGQGNDAIELFQQLESSGICPDDTTFLSLLTACTHAGMVEEGLETFNRMVHDWNVIPNSKHYTCVIDLLGRAGRLDEAYSVIANFPLEPNMDVYSALLGACRVHNDIELGIKISNKLLELRPNDAGYFKLISSMYNLAGNWEGLEMTRSSLRSEGLIKDPGCSSVEIAGVHALQYSLRSQKKQSTVLNFESQT